MGQQEYTQVVTLFESYELLHERHGVGGRLGARGHEGDIVDDEHSGHCLLDAHLEVGDNLVGKRLGGVIVGKIVGRHVVTQLYAVELLAEIVIHLAPRLVGMRTRIASAKLYETQLKVGIYHGLRQCLGSEFGQSRSAVHAVGHHVGYLHGEYRLAHIGVGKQYAYLSLIP